METGRLFKKKKIKRLTIEVLFIALSVMLCQTVILHFIGSKFFSFFSRHGLLSKYILPIVLFLPHLPQAVLPECLCLESDGEKPVEGEEQSRYSSPEEKVTVYEQKVSQQHLSSSFEVLTQVYKIIS